MRLLLLLAVGLAACSSDSNPIDGVGTDDFGVGNDLGDVSLCNVFAQTGCGKGEHCTAGTILGHGADFCIADSAQPLAEGKACVSISAGTFVGDRCARGLVCATFAGQRACRRPCFQHSDCGSQAACLAATGSPSVSPDPALMKAPLLACVDQTPCDPIEQFGCPIGLGCYLARDAEIRITVCEPPAGLNLAAGASCFRTRECAPGELCTSSVVGFCRQLCYVAATPGDAGAAGVCAPGTSCGVLSGTNGRLGLCE